MPEYCLRPVVYVFCTMINYQLLLKIIGRLTIPVSLQYARFYSYQSARQLFEKSSQRHRSNLLLNLSNRDNHIGALEIFRRQLQLGMLQNVDEVVVAQAIKACCDDLISGCQIHCFAVSSGFVSFLSVTNSLMNMYSKCGSFDAALEMFWSLKDPDIVSWNTLLSGCQSSVDALSLACRMNSTGVVFDATSYSTALKFCSSGEEFVFGLQLHSLTVKSGLDGEVFVGNALISLYSRCERLVESRRVFDTMPNKDLVSWNALLSGYTQEGNHGLEAILGFLEMCRQGMKLDHVPFTSAVSASGHEMNLEVGKQIHGMSIKAGYGKHVSVGNVLISLYAKCDNVEDAKLVFEKMGVRNVVSWTTMISINKENAMSLYKEMRLEGDGVYPNDVTFIGLIHAISSEGRVLEGLMIHGYCIKAAFLSELNVYNCFITMYAKFELMEDSIKVFEEFTYREIVSWNALISGYAQNGMCQEALQMFYSSVTESKPNQYTFGSMLSAIGDSESISMRHGQRCHSHVIKLGWNLDPVLSGALLDMYAKRGSICESKKVFDEMPLKTQVAFTAIISAYANHGDFKAAMKLFEQMEREGLKPDSITFLSLITACGRKGMVDTGRQFFNSMVTDHKIKPTPELYSCMVDMLGRAGKLEEAVNFVSQIPGGPGLSALQSLLGSCKIHKDVKMGKRVADALVAMEPMGSGSYVLMSNLYIENGDWDKAAIVRKKMREKGVTKETGYSWVDVSNVGDNPFGLHGFSSGDMSHPQSDEIYRLVGSLGFEIQLLEREKYYCCNSNSEGFEYLYF